MVLGVSVVSGFVFLGAPGTLAGEALILLPFQRLYRSPDVGRIGWSGVEYPDRSSCSESMSIVCLSV